MTAELQRRRSGTGDDVQMIIVTHDLVHSRVKHILMRSIIDLCRVCGRCVSACSNTRVSSPLRLMFETNISLLPRAALRSFCFSLHQPPEIRWTPEQPVWFINASEV